MAIATFSLVALDCPDPHALAAFYIGIIGGEVLWESDGGDWVRVRTEAGVDLGFQLDRDHEDNLQARRDSRAALILDELATRPPADRIAYVPSMDRELDRDELSGGDGNDVVTGDQGILATPLVETALILFAKMKS